MNDSTTLEEVLKELYLVSGFRMSLYDAFGKQLCVYPKEHNPFCHLIQQEKEGLFQCHRFDKDAFEQVSRTGEVYIYRCHCDLYEAVAPLYDFGVLSGYLMMGQVLDISRTSRNQVIQNAENYGIDREKLMRAARGIPCRTKEQIRSCISIMTMCAGYLSLSNHLRADRKDLPANIMAYIRQHYREPITLDNLCEEFYCSRGTLTSAFRKAYGKSIVEYVNQVRMEIGLDLLIRTDQKVGEIATLCGFSDQNYFCRIFKRYYGQAPSCVREKRGL